MGVTLDQLRALFTGVPAADGWSSTPVYDVGLAYEIARRCDTASEVALRELLYDKTPVDEIPQPALLAIQLGTQRYRQHRQLQAAGRGL